MDKKKQEKRYQELATAPVRGLVLKMAFPTIIGMLVSAVYSITDTFFVSMLGDTTKTASVGMVIGMAANMLLDPLLIFGCHMGVLGAGIATAIGQMLSFGVLVSLAVRHGNVGPSLKNFSFSGKLIFQMLGGGMPNFIRQGITSVAGIFLNQAAGVYGGEAITAFTVTYRVFWIVYAVMIGFGQGFQPVCGYNYGAGKAGRVKQAFFFCIRTSTAFMLGMAAVIFLAAEQIISCFSADPEVVAMGVKILRWQSVSMPFLAYYILAGMLFQNIGRFLAATIETAMRQGIFYLPLIFLLPVCMGFDGVVLAQPVADILSFICAVPMGIWVFRKNLREEVGKKL